MKRVYKTADVRAEAGGFAVVLDGRAARTPARNPLVLPNAALARAIVEEWERQDKELRPEAMPLTRIAAGAIDLVGRERARIVGAVAAYAETDLVCHRAERPEALAARQAAAWNPLLDWLASRFGARLSAGAGVLPIAQPDDALASLRAAVEGFDDFALAALHAATAATGSLVIALALAEGRLDAEAAWAASRIDEAFQAEAWGEDAEAKARADALAAEVRAAARFFALLGED